MKEKRAIDARSTQRKRARKILYKLGLDYICVDCGCSPKILPPDAPTTLSLAPVGKRTVTQLQADHQNKNILDNDPVNLAWRCPSCHKKSDKRTQKEVSPIENEFGYEW